jgi:hypothetical protein
MSLQDAVEAMRRRNVPTVPTCGNPWERLEAAPFKGVPTVPTVPTGIGKNEKQAEEERDQGRGAENKGNMWELWELWELINNYKPSSGSHVVPTLPNVGTNFPTPAPVPVKTWDDIRDWIQRGWRAEFGPDGVITWRPPGTWEPIQPEPGETAGAVLPGHPEQERGATGSTGGRRGTSGPVCCGDCGHFEPDRGGFGQGVGRCGLGHRPPGPALYPRAERHCSRFEAKAKATFHDETSGRMAEGQGGKA